MSELSVEEKEAINNLRFYSTDVGFSKYDGTTCLLRARDVQILLNLVGKQHQELEQEKEKNKKYISKNKITNILGLDSTETEETILQYIQTLETENARLEDIENKKVQIEYELIFNKGVNSVKDKIKEILYAHEPGVSIYLLKELLNKEE